MTRDDEILAPFASADEAASDAMKDHVTQRATDQVNGSFMRGRH